MIPDIETKIKAWLPVMKEIEAMGHNPVKLMFGLLSIETTEIVYRALMICKTKYPEWYSVMAGNCVLGAKV